VRVEPRERLEVQVQLTRQAIHEREREAELQRAERLASVGMLASGIAHQFNRILMAVQGHLAFLRDDPPEPERYLEDLEAIA
jgi:C4-dicarboxylate-specific signal transduction histidine kinase